MVQCNTFDERLEAGLLFFENNTDFSLEFIKINLINFVNRIKSVLCYSKTYEKVKCEIKLVKPNMQTIKTFAEDYQLSDHCESAVEIAYLDGNHQTILESPELPDVVNEWFH